MATVADQTGSAHQAVHADLGAQPAKGVLTLDMHGRALDTGDFASDSSMMVASKPRLSAQRRYMRSRMLAQVLSLGTAGASLDVQVGVVHVHLVAEHAADQALERDSSRRSEFS